MISMLANDVRVKDCQRAAIADAMARFTGSITRVEPIARNPKQHRQLVIDGSRDGKALASPEKVEELRAVIRGSGIMQMVIAERLGVREAYVSNILTGRQNVTNERITQIIVVARELAESDAGRRKMQGNPPWARREEIRALMKAHGITVYSVTQRAGISTRGYVSDVLNERIRPSPERAAMIEQAIDTMIQEMKK